MGVSILAKKWPFIGGLDGAGIVEEVGSEVSTFAKGDKVSVKPTLLCSPTYR